MPRVFGSLLLLALLATPCSASDNKHDYHTDKDGARDLYLHSAFAHGLRHGYEEGFHAADLDIHTGSPRKDLTNLSRVPKMVGYRREFGDKKSFRRGYEYGYVAGYADSFGSRKFHYPATAPETATFTSATADFDSGVASGYGAVYHSNSADFPCDRNAPGYCAGFRAGADMALAERHAPAAEVAAGGGPTR